MGNIKIIIKKELDANVPDIKDKIKYAAYGKPLKKHNTNFFRNFFIALGTGVICLFFILIPAFNILPKDTNTYITISVNPSISLTVNNENFVIEQKALNQEAVQILLKQNLVGLTQQQATDKVLSQLNKFGYISDTAKVKVKVENKKKQVEKAEQNKIRNQINGFLKGINISASVEDLTEDELENLLEKYDKDELDKYQKQVLENFRTELISIIESNQLALNNLINNLTPFAIKGSDEIIENAPALKQKILDYSKEYNYDVSEFNLEHITGDSLFNIVEEFRDELEELAEIYEDLLEGADEDDYEDVLEDLFELIYEIYYKK